MDIIKGAYGFDPEAGPAIESERGHIAVDLMMSRAMIGDGATVKATIVDHVLVIEKDEAEIPFSAKLTALFCDEEGQEVKGSITVKLPELTSNLVRMCEGREDAEVEMFTLPFNRGIVLLTPTPETD